MAERLKPLFLARRSYRRRRLIDAACMLPALGLLLFLVPLLWEAGAEGGGDLAGRTLYLFIVWAGLILSARLLAGRLVHDDTAPDDPVAQAPTRDDADGG